VSRQMTLDVGDTTPAAEPDVRVGPIVWLVMCAHRAEPDDLMGWYTHEFDDVVREWVHENAEATVARLLDEDSGLDVQQHSTRTEAKTFERRIEEYRDSDPTEQQRLVTDGGSISPPPCSVDGCDTRSAYLLPPEGDLCERHAAEKHPDTVAYLRATAGRPPAAEAAANDEGGESA